VNGGAGARHRKQLSLLTACLLGSRAWHCQDGFKERELASSQIGSKDWLQTEGPTPAPCKILDEKNADKQTNPSLRRVRPRAERNWTIAVLTPAISVQPERRLDVFARKRIAG
jgi:hypothetical protein